MHLVSKARILFSRLSKQNPRFTAVQEDGGDKRLVEFELMVLYRQILFSLAVTGIAESFLMWTSAEQVPSLHKVVPKYVKLVNSSNFYSGRSC